MTIDLKDWNVLVVDDEPDNRIVLETLLDFYDAKVTSTSSGEEAIALLPDGNFKLALLDMQMPKVTGWDLVKFIRNSDNSKVSGMCTVAVTAMAMKGDQERIIEAGFDGYIAKPLDAAEFLKALELILAKHNEPSAAIVLRQDMPKAEETLSPSDKIKHLLHDTAKMNTGSMMSLTAQPVGKPAADSESPFDLTAIIEAAKDVPAAPQEAAQVEQPSQPSEPPAQTPEQSPTASTNDTKETAEATSPTVPPINTNPAPTPISTSVASIEPISEPKAEMDSDKKPAVTTNSAIIDKEQASSAA